MISRLWFKTLRDIPKSFKRITISKEVSYTKRHSVMESFLFSIWESLSRLRIQLTKLINRSKKRRSTSTRPIQWLWTSSNKSSRNTSKPPAQVRILLRNKSQHLEKTLFGLKMKERQQRRNKRRQKRPRKEQQLLQKEKRRRALLKSQRKTLMKAARRVKKKKRVNMTMKRKRKARKSQVRRKKLTSLRFLESRWHLLREDLSGLSSSVSLNTCKIWLIRKRDPKQQRRRLLNPQRMVQLRTRRCRKIRMLIKLKLKKKQERHN